MENLQNASLKDILDVNHEPGREANDAYLLSLSKVRRQDIVYYEGVHINSVPHSTSLCEESHIQ